MRKRLLLVLFIFSLFLILLVFFRVIDADELAFLTAARETLKGKVCYRDFFLPQMPFSFLFLIPFANWGITGFFLGRILNLGLGIIFGLLLFKYLFLRIEGSDLGEPKEEMIRLGFIFITLFYFANGLILAWVPVNKPHILVNLFNLLSLFFLYQEKYLLSGLFLGLAGETRAIFLLFLPFYLYYLYRFRNKRGMGRLLLGFLLSQSIGLYYFLSAPQNFFLDNIYYHLVRGEIRDGILSRLFSDEILFGRFFTLVKVFVLPQNFLLFILTVLAFYHYRKNPQLYHFEFFALILGITTFTLYYLIVAPAHFQYFIQVLPFLLIFNLPFFLSRIPKKGVKFPFLLVTLFYLFGSAFTIYNYASGLHPFYQRYRIGLIKKLVDEIERNSIPEEEILVFYPNLPVLAKISNLSDYETCPDFSFAERFPAERRRILHLSSREEIREKIRQRIPRLVVGILGEEEKRFYQLEAVGYKKIKEIFDYEIYKREEE
jgi:hypothetical protein